MEKKNEPGVCELALRVDMRHKIGSGSVYNAECNNCNYPRWLHGRSDCHCPEFVPREAGFNGLCCK